MTAFVRLTPWILLGLLAACASPSRYGPPSDRPGQTETDIVEQLGRPNDRHPMPGGVTRLEFARGPMGRHTYMVDVDATGRVIAWRQVLDPVTVTTRVRAGMTLAQVRQELGRPGRWLVEGASGRRVAYWRFESPQRCEVLSAEFDGDVLVQAGVTGDPNCR